MHEKKCFKHREHCDCHRQNEHTELVCLNIRGTYLKVFSESNPGAEQARDSDDKAVGAMQVDAIVGALCATLLLCHHVPVQTSERLDP